MLNIILFGPPGAGKGTQSELLMQRYNLNYISTGEVLRNEIRQGTILGMKARSIIESGGLVDDEIIVQIIGNFIRSEKQAEGFLFDGFPRTYVQAYILDGLLTRLQTSLTRIFILDVTDEECTRRLLQRAKEQNRADDNEQVITRRLGEYHKKTLPLLGFYESSGIVTHISGLGTTAEVFSRINQQMEQELSQRRTNLILFGYPGSGRATQARKLAEALQLNVISTGELLQEERKSGSATGCELDRYLDNGLLVPDEIVVRLIEKKLREESNTNRGWIFKGYPRTLVQAYILDGLLRKQGSAISAVINLQVPHLELVRRLDARSRTNARMPYDISATTIVARLEEHENRTLPVLDYYAGQNPVINVNATGAPDDIFNTLLEPVLKAVKRLK